MTTYGYLRQDDDGHWYCVPENCVKDFDLQLCNIAELEEGSEEWEDANMDFGDAFEKYRLEGGPYDLRVVIPEVKK